MDCKKTSEYLRLLTLSIDSNLEVNDNVCLELKNHIESCTKCSGKWMLGSSLINKLEKHYDAIKPSDFLKKKIQKSIKNETSKLYRMKTISIAVSFVLVLGSSIFINQELLRLPYAHEIHNVSNYHLSSNNIENLIQHIEVPLSKNHFANFEKASFIPDGSIKIHKPLNKRMSTIALKNNKGQKLTLCFYPENYKIAHKDIVDVDGIKVYQGSTNNHNFAYWATKGMTIVLISDSLLPHEIIDLATPMIISRA